MSAYKTRPSSTHCDLSFLDRTRLNTALDGSGTLLKQRKALFKEFDVRAMYLLLGTDEKLTGLALPNLVGTRSLAEQCRNEGYFLLWCTR
jgi:hypothetical protein